MDITGAIKSVATVVSQWMSRVWGTQTRDQSAVERDIANAREQKSLAFESLKGARTDDEIRTSLRTVNYWDLELTRLYHEAAAKWP